MVIVALYQHNLRIRKKKILDFNLAQNGQSLHCIPTLKENWPKHVTTKFFQFVQKHTFCTTLTSNSQKQILDLNLAQNGQQLPCIPTLEENWPKHVTTQFFQFVQKHTFSTTLTSNSQKQILDFNLAQNGQYLPFIPTLKENWPKHVTTKFFQFVQKHTFSITLTSNSQKQILDLNLAQCGQQLPCIPTLEENWPKHVTTQYFQFVQKHTFSTTLTSNSQKQILDFNLAQNGQQSPCISTLEENWPKHVTTQYFQFVQKHTFSTTLTSNSQKQILNFYLAQNGRSLHCIPTFIENWPKHVTTKFFQFVQKHTFSTTLSSNSQKQILDFNLAWNGQYLPFIPTLKENWPKHVTTKFFQFVQKHTFSTTLSSNSQKQILDLNLAQCGQQLPCIPTLEENWPKHVTTQYFQFVQKHPFCTTLISNSQKKFLTLIQHRMVNICLLFQH